MHHFLEILMSNKMFALTIALVGSGMFLFGTAWREWGKKKKDDRNLN